MAAHKYREAIAAYNQAVQLDPYNAAIWRSMEDLYFHLKRKAFAVQCYDEVLKLRPEDVALRQWLETYRK